MATEEQKGTINISAPAQPKIGGAIASFGGWGAVGTTGSASLAIPVPISQAPNRGMVPALSLSYSSHVGNSIFGIGWHLTVNAITVRTSKGVPLYDQCKDLMVGADGETWMPELDAQGKIIYRDVTVGRTTYQAIRYQPRIEGGFAKIERLTNENDPAGFWLICTPEGNCHIYGKTLASRRAEPRDESRPQEPERVGVWLLDEIVTPLGKHIVYEYKAETEEPVAPHFRDYRAQRYLQRVLYGNAKAEPELYSLKEGGWKGVDFHFHLLFDYGERSHDLTQIPAYGLEYLQEGDQYGDWLERSDPFWNHDYGFELGTRRLCRQVLMFHHFRNELGDSPKLVQRLFLQHRQGALEYNHLTAAHLQAYDRHGKVESRPPLEFSYAPFDLKKADQHGWKAFPQMPGLNDGQRYQLVDLYGKGMPGILCRYDKAWFYREPLRDNYPSDDVRYGDLTELPYIPLADSSKPLRQTLTDLNGDGKLEWGVHAPTMNGYFTMNPDRQWSGFVPYKAFPLEYFHRQAQMADLVGDGRTHMALIGSNSVRLYTNLGDDKGFSAGRDVEHDNDDALPLPSNSETEVVGFSDVLGSGKQHLFRLRHDSLECWPNLGHGRFGKRIALSAPTFSYESFNASQVLLADLDGSGATDLIYLQSDGFLIFMNHCGKGFATEHVEVLWPEGVRYDRLCQVTTADLLGLGCTSLVLTVPHMSPRHWRYDFVKAKPYLVNRSNNNMGTLSLIDYRSSAQEFLDEEYEHHQIDKDKIVVSEVPFAMHLVKRQTQIDEITGNKLTQLMSYRQGYYDPFERLFRGFGLLVQTDTEATEAERNSLGFTAPILSKTWFHTGKTIDPPRDGYYSSDAQAVALKATKLERFHPRDGAGEPLAPDEETARQIAHALSGSPRRTEIFDRDNPCVPYAVTEARYQVRLLRAKNEHYPYAKLQLMTLESISYQYERELPDDPRCEHSLSLKWDVFGNVLHAMIVYYARRKTDESPPFDDEHKNRYWKDAHDKAQQRWYLTESKAEFIHVDHEDGWKSGMPFRLGLPYRERSNALVLEKAQLSIKDIHHENFLEWSKDEGEWAKQSVLAGMSMQLYTDPLNGQTLEQGKATVHALQAHVEIAELDAKALSAYDKLMVNGKMPFNLKEKLQSTEVGYHIMKWFLPEVEQSEPTDPTDAKNYLWSVHRGFPKYHDAQGFYNVESFQQTRSHGITKVKYDPYWCLHTSIELPDGCITQILDTDYCTFLPAAIKDPNQNTQEARYNAFGEVLVTSFYGTELGKAVGFDPLSDYERPDDRSPAHAIEFPFVAIGNYAMAMFSDAFSWMGRLPTTEQPEGWLTWALAEGFVLPSGHLCDHAREHLHEIEAPTPFELLLQQYVEAAHREPVHIAILQADRYPDDQDLQIRIAISHQDGFSRVLQTKQEVEPGKAWVVLDDGTLKLKDDGTPAEAEAVRRWRVSEPVEYNNKGEKVRIYRPYFADRGRYIKDHSMREHAYHDQQFYDAAGRPTKTVLAKKMPQGERSEMKPLRREMWYWIWCTVAFDENDLFEPPPAATRRTNRTLH